MRLQISYGLECGHINKPPEIKYSFNTGDKYSDDLDASRYDSQISFNRPGNRLYCKVCNDMTRIQRISIIVVEFDTEITV